MTQTRWWLEPSDHSSSGRGSIVEQSRNIGASASSPIIIHTSEENTAMQSQGKSARGLSILIIQAMEERVLLYSHETWVVGAQVP